MTEKHYDSMIMRIAGNLLSGSVEYYGRPRMLEADIDVLAETAVRLARAIVSEVLRTRTEPQEP